MRACASEWVGPLFLLPRSVLALLACRRSFTDIPAAFGKQDSLQPSQFMPNGGRQVPIERAALLHTKGSFIRPSKTDLGHKAWEINCGSAAAM